MAWPILPLATWSESPTSFVCASHRRFQAIARLGLVLCHRRKERVWRVHNREDRVPFRPVPGSWSFDLGPNGDRAVKWPIWSSIFGLLFHRPDCPRQRWSADCIGSTTFGRDLFVKFRRPRKRFSFQDENGVGRRGFPPIVPKRRDWSR